MTTMREARAMCPKDPAVKEPLPGTKRKVTVGWGELTANGVHKLGPNKPPHTRMVLMPVIEVREGYTLVKPRTLPVPFRAWARKHFKGRRDLSPKLSKIVHG